ncbi:hypothetical protein MAXJ12_26988 [Mesorhizobium alhagi CCNWXJ12-2]|uniref:Uncharacterized protein n=1 Tax=Mesorhizobium alhagi CCNWXJ12-2 TaxID=1107882 RepID=H0HYW3_9HYPH|nr:hypothetical protein MAXJ12_26988 [Mesorhizobium alhagi CCNWXJ12-2]
MSMNTLDNRATYLVVVAGIFLVVIVGSYALLVDPDALNPSR